MAGSESVVGRQELLAWDTSVPLAERLAAVRRLAAAGHPAQEALCLALEDPSPRVRRLAARHLAEVGDAGAAAALNKAFRRCCFSVTRASVVTLALIPVWMLTGLALLLGGPVWVGCLFAIVMIASWVAALRYSGYTLSLAEAVVQVAERYPTDHARAALQRLWDLDLTLCGRSRRRLRVLIGRLETICRQNPHLRAHATEIPATAPHPAIRLPPYETADELLARYRTLPSAAERQRAIPGLAESKDRAVPVLCEALRDESFSVRAAAATELGLLRDARAILPLQEALRDSFRVRSPLLDRLLFGPSLLHQPPILFLLSQLPHVIRIAFPQLAPDAAALILAVSFLLQVPVFLGLLGFGRSAARRELASALVGVLEAQTDVSLGEAGVKVHQVRRDLHAIKDHATGSLVRRFDFLIGSASVLPIPASPPIPDALSLPLPAPAEQWDDRDCR